MCLNFGPKKDKINARMNSSYTSLDSANSPVPSSSRVGITKGVKCLIIGVPVDIFSINNNNFPDLASIFTNQRAHILKIVEGIKYLSP